MIKDYRAPEEIPIFLPVIIFISLLVGSLLVAKAIWRLGTKAVNDLPNSDFRNETIHFELVFLQILGLYFFITSLAVIPNHVFQYLTSHGNSNLEYGLWIFATVFKLVMGLLLLTKAKVLLILLTKLR